MIQIRAAAITGKDINAEEDITGKDIIAEEDATAQGINVANKIAVYENGGGSYFAAVFIMCARQTHLR